MKGNSREKENIQRPIEGKEKKWSTIWNGPQVFKITEDKVPCAQQKSVH